MSVRHLFTYLCFLATTTVAAFGMRTEYQYYLTKAVSLAFSERLFSDRGIYYQDVASVPDVWAFLSEVALPSLFPADGHNGTTSKYVVRENYLLGLARLRQLRVRNDSCPVHEDFRPYIYACYGEYSEASEDLADFGPSDGTAWRHHSSEELSGSSHWGRLATYEGSGYYEDLGPTRELAVERLADLSDGAWIRRATRVVFLDFTVYNANVNLFAIVKLVLELPATGSVWPSLEIHSVKLLRYVNSWDHFILGCEVVFCLFTVYYLVEELLEIKRLKLVYLKLPWNLLDLLILLLSIACIGFSIYRTVLVESMLHKLLDDPNHHPPFWILGFWQAQYDTVVAVLVFFCWVKVFKYLSFNKTMTQLATTLSKCAKDVGGFGIMFCIVFMAYAQLGYLLFGSQLHDFSRFHLAVFTLLRIILGDFDFDAIQQANRVVGPVFFVSYVFFVFFILLNMFLAIISDTYTEVKAELHREPHRYHLVQFLRKVYSVLRETVVRRRVDKLKRAGHERKSEPDPDGGVGEDDAREGMSATQQQPIEMSPATAIESRGNGADLKFATVNDFERLAGRVDSVCHELEQIQKAIVTKLSAVEKNLAKVAAKRSTRSF